MRSMISNCLCRIYGFCSRMADLFLLWALKFHNNKKIIYKLILYNCSFKMINCLLMIIFLIQRYLKIRINHQFYVLMNCLIILIDISLIKNFHFINYLHIHSQFICLGCKTNDLLLIYLRHDYSLFFHHKRSFYN